MQLHQTKIFDKFLDTIDIWHGWVQPRSQLVTYEICKTMGICVTYLIPFVFQISLAEETSVHLTMVAFCPPPEQQSLIHHNGSESIQNEIFVFKYCTLWDYLNLFKSLIGIRRMYDGIMHTVKLNILRDSSHPHDCHFHCDHER